MKSAALERKLWMSNNPSLFLEKSDRFLLENFSANGLFISAADAMAKCAARSWRWFALEEESQVHAAAALNPSGRLLVAEMDRSMASSFGFVLSQNRCLPLRLRPIYILAAPDLAEELLRGVAMAEKIPAETLFCQPHIKQILWTKTLLEKDLVSEAKVVVAQKNHHALILQWMRQFDSEIGILPGHRPAENWLEEGLKNNQIFLFLNAEQEPQCMASTIVIRNHTARLHLVFTPKQNRRKRAAHHLIEGVMAHCKRIGIQEVNLFTDAESVAADGLYRGLGFNQLLPFYELYCDLKRQT